MHTVFRKLFIFLFIITLVLPGSIGLASPSRQAITADDQAQAMLDSLTPEERVGQLFWLHSQDLKLQWLLLRAPKSMI